ncbi:hypothetical protein D3C83_192470 [compost metagenome]
MKTIEKGGFSGSRLRSCTNASSPPAEAPIPTTGHIASAAAGEAVRDPAGAEWEASWARMRARATFFI